MVFYGAGGHAKVIIESFLAAGGKLTGILDDNVDFKNLLSYPVSGKYDPDKFPGSHFIISIGNNSIRNRITKSIAEIYGQVIHPAATISPSVAIGMGTVIMAGAILNAETRLGDHVIINTGSQVDHDGLIADYVHIAPGSVLCGHVNIGEGALIGTGAVVLPGVKIGKWVTVAAGAVVTKNVKDYAVVAGVPARVIGLNAGPPDGARGGTSGAA